MKKVLIFLNEGSLKPAGGECGYNYNLKKGLDSIDTGSLSISFLQGQSDKDKISRYINKIASTRLKAFIMVVKSIVAKGKLMYARKHILPVNIEQYDVVHFHRTMDLYKMKDGLKHYSGKVVLTSHVPTAPAKETFDNLSEFEKKYLFWFYRKLEEVDRYAFERADNIIFPCREAEEPYYHQWREYERIHTAKADKYKYLLTGTEAKNALWGRRAVRKKYKIPENAFTIAYVGRHNEIKGYGQLKEIGERIIQKYKDIYFLVAGKEEPLQGLSNSRWIEIGWTNEPGSVIKAADLFILPNKETYFDMVLLEVLSLGQLVLISETGGNKYFKKYADKGIFFYNGSEEAIVELENIYALSEEQRKALGESNRKIYEEEFTNEAFAKRYVHVMKEILEEK